MKALKKVLKSSRNVLIGVGFVIVGVATSETVYQKNFSKAAKHAKIRAIYHDIVVQTGQTQNAVPLHIVDKDIENAYTDGKKIVIYTGLVNNAASWDEVALVLAHEVAHVNLGHVGTMLPPVIFSDGMGANDYVSVMEANADKMGAVYLMKAGYDVCNAREIYKRWKHRSGNFLGQNHPNYSYRYDELNINCGRD